METLVIKTIEAVDADTATFKKIGHTNIRYFAQPSKLNQATPSALMHFNLISDGNPTTISIEGAKMFKVSGGVVDTVPYQNEITFSETEIGVRGVAFIPSKEAGYVRIKDGGKKITRFYLPQRSLVNNPDDMQIGLDFDAMVQSSSFFHSHQVVSGYTPTGTNIFGDINSITYTNSAGASVIIGDEVVIIDKLSNSTLTRKFKSGTNLNFYIARFGGVKLTVDLSVFDNIVNMNDFYLPSSFVVKGNVNHVLSIANKITLNTLDTTGVTGSINNISSTVTSVSLNIRNLTGGYTSRNYTGAITNFEVLSDLITESDYDLILSDLANKAPLLSNTAKIQLSRRSAASDASVSTLQSKGCTVIIGG